MKRLKHSVAAAALVVMATSAAQAAPVPQVNTDPIGILGAKLYNYSQSDYSGAFTDYFTFSLGGTAAKDTVTLTAAPANLGYLLHENVTSFGLETASGAIITPTSMKTINNGLYNGPEYIYSGLTKGTSYKVVVLGTANGFLGGQDAITLNVTPSAVPVPGAAWLFLSGLVGLSAVQLRRRLAKPEA